MAKWGKSLGFLRKHKQANYSILKATNYRSVNIENSYGSKSKDKVFSTSTHAIKVYGGVEV